MLQVVAPPIHVVLSLNDYRLAIDGKRWQLTGPDEVVVAEARRRFIALIATDDGRKMMARAVRLEDGPALEQIEARLIQALALPQSAPRTRPEPATPNQKAYAHFIGMPVADHLSASELARRLRDFNLMRTYVELVWRSITDSKPIDAGIASAQLNQLTMSLVSHDQLLHRVREARLLKIDENDDGVATGGNPGSLPGGDPGGDPAAHLRLNQNDPLFAEVAAILRLRWKRHLPGNWLSKLSRRLGR
ncbi:MAG: hypothetical protein WD042_06575 [Phycisphaeraceae bacterium]